MVSVLVIEDDQLIQAMVEEALSEAVSKPPLQLQGRKQLRSFKPINLDIARS